MKKNKIRQTLLFPQMRSTQHFQQKITMHALYFVNLHQVLNNIMVNHVLSLFIIHNSSLIQ